MYIDRENRHVKETHCATKNLSKLSIKIENIESITHLYLKEKAVLHRKCNTHGYVKRVAVLFQPDQSSPISPTLLHGCEEIIKGNETGWLWDGKRNGK